MVVECIDMKKAIGSYQGEAIRKLAAELYQQVVNEKRESTKYLSKADKQQPNQEITKGQYEEMRKMLE